MRRRPTCGRIRRRDELGRHFTCCAERGIVEDGEVFLDRPAGRIRWQARGTLDATAVAGVSLDQAGIDGKTLAGPTSPSSMQRCSTVSNRRRSRSLSRKRPCRFFEKVE